MFKAYVTFKKVSDSLTFFNLIYYLVPMSKDLADGKKVKKVFIGRLILVKELKM